METFHLICYILAALAFLTAAIRDPQYWYPADPGRRWLPNLVALGLFFWVLIPLIDAIRAY